MTLIDRPSVVPAPAAPAPGVPAPGVPAPVVTGSPTGSRRSSWVDVCALDDLPLDRGVCALVGGRAVALFRCWPHDELYALGNLDPYSEASVLSRGIVGSVGDVPVVASPIFKQRFDLRTGGALDDPAVGVPTFAVHVVDGRVLVDPHERDAAGAA